MWRKISDDSILLIPLHSLITGQNWRQIRSSITCLYWYWQAGHLVLGKLVGPSLRFEEWSFTDSCMHAAKNISPRRQHYNVLTLHWQSVVNHSTWNKVFPIWKNVKHYLYFSCPHCKNRKGVIMYANHTKNFTISDIASRAVKPASPMGRFPKPYWTWSLFL